MTIEERIITDDKDEITVTRWAGQSEIWIGIRYQFDSESMLMELSTTDAK